MPANWQRGSLATMSSLQCNATLGTQLIKMQMQMQEDGAKTKGVRYRLSPRHCLCRRRCRCGCGNSEVAFSRQTRDTVAFHTRSRALSELAVNSPHRET